MWVLGLVFRLVFCAALVLAVCRVWQRGMGETWVDVEGWVRGVQMVWGEEYRRYEGVGRGAGGGGNDGGRWY